MHAINIAAPDHTTQPLRDPDAGLFSAAPRQSARAALRRAGQYLDLRLQHGRPAFKRLISACEAAEWTPGRAANLLTFAKWFVAECTRRRRAGRLTKAEALRFPARHPSTTREYIAFMVDVVGPQGCWEWAEAGGSLLMSGFFMSPSHQREVEARWDAARAKQAERDRKRRAKQGKKFGKHENADAKPEAFRTLSTARGGKLEDLAGAARRAGRPNGLPLGEAEGDDELFELVVVDSFCEKKEKAPLQPLPPQVAEPQPPDPPPAPVVAGEPLVFALDLPDRARYEAYTRLLVSQDGLSAAQNADYEAICRRLAQADDARVAAEAAQREARRPSPAALSAPSPDATRASGVRVHPEAHGLHERLLDQVRERLGLPLADDPAMERQLCLAPATRKQLDAAVPGVAAFPGLSEKLLARGLSLLAIHHGFHAIQASDICMRGDVVALTIHAAKRTQRYFGGESDGWCPYSAWLAKKHRRMNYRGNRKWPPRW